MPWLSNPEDGLKFNDFRIRFYEIYTCLITARRVRLHFISSDTVSVDYLYLNKVIIKVVKISVS